MGIEGVTGATGATLTGDTAGGGGDVPEVQPSGGGSGSTDTGFDSADAAPAAEPSLAEAALDAEDQRKIDQFDAKNGEGAAAAASAEQEATTNSTETPEPAPEPPAEGGGDTPVGNADGPAADAPAADAGAGTGADAGPQASEGEGSSPEAAGAAPAGPQGSAPGPVDRSEYTAEELRDGNQTGELDEVIDEQQAEVKGLEESIEIQNGWNSVPVIGWITSAFLNTDDEEEDLEEVDEELKQNAALNFIADTGHVLGGNEETSEEINAADGDIVVNESQPFQAVHNDDTDTVTLGGSFIEEAIDLYEEAVDEGIANEDGDVTNAEELDVTKIGDEAAKAFALMYHEIGGHGHADESGENALLFNTISSYMKTAATQAETQASGLATNSFTQLNQAYQGALAEAERMRVAGSELEAYSLQENEQIKMGAYTPLSLTVDENGEALPEDQAVSNIMAFQQGTSIPFGPSANSTYPAVAGVGNATFLGAALTGLEGTVWGNFAEADIANSAALIGDESGRGFPGRGFPGRGFPGRGFP